MKKEEYLRCVTDQIRCKKACPGIEKELEDHITDQAEMYLKKGNGRKSKRTNCRTMICSVPLAERLVQFCS